MADRPHLRISSESVNNRNTEFDGGGSTYRRSDYYSHGKLLMQGLNTIQQKLNVSNDIVKDRAFIEIKLAQGEKLKDRYKNLQNNAQIVVSDVINESTGYGYIKTDDILSLSSKLRKYAESEDHTGRSYFSFVEEFSNINSIEKVSPRLRTLMEEEGENDCIAVTIESFSNLPREATDFGFLRQCKAVLEGKGSVISSYVHTSGSVVVEVSTTPDGIKALVQNFESIRSMDITPRMFLPISQSLNNVDQHTDVKQLDGDAKVCIFDSGTFSGNPQLDPYIINRINGIRSDEYDTSHGSFVASRIIYRDNVDDQLASGLLTPYVKVLDVRVFGLDYQGSPVGLNESELISVIRQTVSDWYQEIKVYNLSLGFLDPITDATFLSDIQVSRIASELDALSKEKDVLFVISAGNINSLYEKMQTIPYPDYFSDDTTRILPPGELFLGLTVGSIATRSENGALGSINHPSPFSRRGPGSFGTLKPEIVVDGGNVTSSGNSDLRLYSVALGQNANELVYNVGTSFAAPVVSSYAAELFDRIPDASVNLVKGLLVHFSNHPVEINNYPRINKLEHIGFGITNFQNCLESLRSKATYLYEGSVPQQTYVKIPFWVPTILASDRTRSGRKKLKIRITIVWNPITDRRKLSEYSLNHLNLNLFKVSDDGQEREVTIPLSQLLTPSHKMKFFPVIRIEKEFERSFAGGLWSIQLRLSHRWDVPEEYEQDFAAIISVEDPQNTLDVYDEIVNEIGTRVQPLVQVRN